MSEGLCSFCWNFTERQILWSLCSVDFHTLTLQLPIQTPHSVAPELQVFVSSLKFSVKRAHPRFGLNTFDNKYFLDTELGWNICGKLKWRHCYEQGTATELADPSVVVAGVCSFCRNFTERQILWSLCSVDFHTFTLQLPIQTLHSVVPELQVFVSSLNFSVKRAHPWGLGRAPPLSANQRIIW